MIYIIMIIIYTIIMIIIILTFSDVAILNISHENAQV